MAYDECSCGNGKAMWENKCPTCKKNTQRIYEEGKVNPNAITIHSNYERREYFFSTDHCQRLIGKNYPDEFVPITHHFPMSVGARPSLPSGIINNINDLLLIFYKGSKLIANPDSHYAHPLYGNYQDLLSIHERKH